MAEEPYATYDVVVVGSGPNGLAAAITMARAGRSVLVLEAKETPGGGVRSGELTLPGFTHDICSAIHPLGVGSPFFRQLPLKDHGLEWIVPPLPVAHPLDDGTAAVLETSVYGTSARLGRDGPAYRALMAGPVRNWPVLDESLLAPVLRIPPHPFALMQFGLRAIWPAAALSRALFRKPGARGLFAGLAAHSIQPLEFPLTSSFGLVLGALGHVYGWPFPRGGTGKITDALVSYFKSLGGRIEMGVRVGSLDELPAGKMVFLDVTPRQWEKIGGDRLPADYRKRLTAYRYGPGVFKLDWALDGPIPWRAEECSRASTVHLGPTLEEICVSERAAWSGRTAERPYVLLAQQSMFDPTRAPAGKHTIWAYCHVPRGSTEDMTDRIEAQIERFAPGFRDRILKRAVMTPAGFEEYNENYVGGDIGGGANDAVQLFTRPIPQMNPYGTPIKGVYLCSASTPPGGGVHGMCGYHAARAALSEQGD